MNVECPPPPGNLCTLPSYFYDDSSSEYEDDMYSCENTIAPFTPDTPQNHPVSKTDVRGSRILDYPCNFEAASPQRESVFQENFNCFKSSDSFTEELSYTPDPQDGQAVSSNRQSVFDPIHKSLEVESTPNSISGIPNKIKPDVMTSIAGATARPTWEQSLYQIEDVMHGLQVIKGEDAEFNICLSNLLRKLSVAHGDLKSAYLFRDFAGSFTNFLDRFGPGAYDSHKAPQGISWIIKIILPWLQMCHPEYRDQYSIYSEVSGWAFNIVHLLGQSHSNEILDEGLWDSCCDQLAHSDFTVNSLAYNIAKKIMLTLDLNLKLLNKVLLLRHRTFGFDDVEMFHIRSYRVKLLRHLLYRISYTLPTRESKSYTYAISHELRESLEIESNTAVLKATDDCIKLADRLSDGLPLSVGAIPPANHPHYGDPTSSPHSSLCYFPNEDANVIYSTDITDDNDLQIDEGNTNTAESTQGSMKVSRRTRIWNKLSRMMNHMLAKPIPCDETDMRSSMDERPSDTRSCYTVRTHRTAEIIRTVKRTLRGKGTATPHNEFSTEGSSHAMEAMFTTTHQMLLGE